MNLRTKILAYVIAVMGIVFVMLAATLIPDTVHQTERAQAAGKSAVNALQAVLEQLDARQRSDMFAEHPMLFREEKILDGWILLGPGDSIQTWEMPEPKPAGLTPDSIAGLHFQHHVPVTAKDGERLTLYARINEAHSPYVDLWGLFSVMAVGTLLLASVIYGLILRLVIKPVERLAVAARSPGIAKGLLTQVPHSERQDEIGDLVRAYNKMAGEVNDLRLNLEKRVSEATRNLEAAQGQIVTSERLSVAGRMAAGVAHEINNPLAGMLNAARVLKAKRETALLARHQSAVEIINPRESEYLELILEGLSRIQSIVASMLQFSRPAKEACAVDLSEVMEGALLFCRHRFSKMNMKLEKQYNTEHGPLRVTGHRSELGQVLLNLIMNALDAMEANGPGPHTLTLNLVCRDSNVWVSVTDTGTGMPKEVKERAGQFFFTTKRDGQGTGLGLAIAHHIVAEHRGAMNIESTQGKGTTVSLQFPMGE